jgi:hypothetical protein
MVKKAATDSRALRTGPWNCVREGTTSVAVNQGRRSDPLQTTAGDTNLFQLVNSIAESNAIGFDTEQLTIDAISLRSWRAG